MQWPLVVLAGLFLATPLALAVAVDLQVRAFEAEAFGHLRKAARNLRVMAWSILVYYAGVVGTSLAAGDIAELLNWPLSPEGLAIYARIGAAILAYVLGLRVAKELYLVTRPGKMAPGAPLE